MEYWCKMSYTSTCNHSLNLILKKLIFNSIMTEVPFT